jgi:hypothetical protein
MAPQAVRPTHSAENIADEIALRTKRAYHRAGAGHRAIAGCQHAMVDVSGGRVIYVANLADRSCSPLNFT